MFEIDEAIYGFKWRQILYWEIIYILVINTDRRMSEEEVIYADDLTLTTMCNDVKHVETKLRVDTGKSFDWC